MSKKQGCRHFKRTGITASSIEEACSICPLRNEAGDCIEDIIQDKGEEMGAEIAAIWEKFYGQMAT